MFKSPFTASPRQVAAYLLGVALFSISFLVFINASVSFVITDLIGQKEKVGDAVGTLGFADELVALVACPCWGMLSDRLGTKNVVFIGYTIVALSLFIFVQAENVYPQLLLARLFFSVGGAATATMVTAILPTMTLDKSRRKSGATSVPSDLSGNAHNFPTSVSSEATLTPARFSSSPAADRTTQTAPASSKSATSQIAGLVGMFTGLGALIALGAFLPLPARLQHAGFTPGHAVASSFYIVGSIAFCVALGCLFGLRNLAGEESKGWRNISGKLDRKADSAIFSSGRQPKAIPLPRLFLEATRLGFTDVSIGLGYLGGFVARASSVGISLFIPLYVNAYFINKGLCKDDPFSNPEDVKEQCRRAYTLAAALSGVSQVVALVGAPIFGSLDGKFRRFNMPLLFAAMCGMAGYIALGKLKSPDPKSEDGGPGVFVVMALLGISQIGAIVCSLSLLGRGIDGGDETHKAPLPYRSNIDEDDGMADGDESAYLLPSHLQSLDSTPQSRRHLKGSIAGLYSLTGGAGILLLTKLGGYLFDSLSTGAPFYMLAIFNGVLLAVGLVCGIGVEIRKNREQMSLGPAG